MICLQRYLQFSIWIVGLIPLSAQVSTPPMGEEMLVVRVSHVTFSGGTHLMNDDGSLVTRPHWIDEMNNGNPDAPPFPDGAADIDSRRPKPDDVKSYAHSYSATENPAVQAVFKWKNQPPAARGPYSAEGQVVDTPNSGFFLERKVLVDDYTKYPETKSIHKVVQERRIQAYLTENRKIERSDGTKDTSKDLVPLTIEWTVYDKDNKPVSKSRSTHTIYVTWDKPATSLRQETIFNLSCVMANDEIINEADKGKAVFAKIWSEYTDRVVRRMDGRTMGYYSIIPFVDYVDLDSVSELISTADGPCQRWANFLKATFSVHGGGAAKTSAITPLFTPVNDGTNGIIDLRPFAVAMVVNQHQCDLPPPYPKQVDPATDLRRIKDAPAQGTLKPAKFTFGDHAVVRFGNSEEIFDPSYGISCEDLNDWEVKALSFCVASYNFRGFDFYLVYENKNSTIIGDL